ncbi:MAG: tRNA1(Val) (adenine(37)-N6)-methyltransferase [Firmicutes bacterium]|jgi:tRNA1Val (adenine37-N6)-methyltransferase|nr:tRNA1(Val) (adenine(37)-N6)-methyltransferase [Bacillota bacterium]
MKVINNVLGFDGIKIVQDSEGFKFSLDSVLLANFVTLNKSTKKIMDIGSGNGIIPILLSLKTDAHIDGVEIQREGYLNSLESIKLNKMDNISIFNDDIKEFYKTLESDTYDVVVSNPPYFMGNIHNINEMKKIARHSLSLDYKDVIVISKKILKNNGLLSIVHRPENLMDILMFMRSNNIEPKKIRFVYPYKGKNANILLVEGAKNGKPGLKVMDPLYVYENGNYTEEIKKYFE